MSKKKKKNKESLLGVIKFDTSEPLDLLMLPFTVGNERAEYKCNEVANCSVFKEFMANNCHGHVNTKIAALSAAKQLLDQEDILSSSINDISRMYVHTHECDQNLCILRKNKAENTAYDILDFTEYDNDKDSRDVLKAAITALNDMHINTTDTSLLWSTNEYIRIKYTPSIEFMMKRIGYNAEKKCIDYMMIVYNHRTFLQSEIITIPNTIATISVDFVAANDMLQYKSENEELDNINDASLLWYKTKMMADVLNTNENTAPRQYIYPRINITSMSDENTVKLFVNKIQKLLKRTEMYVTPQKLDLLRALYIGLLKETSNNQDISSKSKHAVTYQNISIAIACIILTNIMLQTKKLSPPEKPSGSTVIHTTADSVSNSPIRKTRHIGGIKITSEKRPSNPTMQKIIKYSASEWERRGFMRHYKNGKTIFIEPTTVHRKCVNIDKNQKTKATTKYIVHSNDEMKGKQYDH